MPPKQTKLSFNKKAPSESEQDDFEISDGSDVDMPPPKKSSTTKSKSKSKAPQNDDDDASDNDDDDGVHSIQPRGGSTKQKSASETYQKVCWTYTLPFPFSSGTQALTT